MLGVWAVLRTQLTATDDSFDFNRTLGRLKSMIAALPVATPEDEVQLQAQQVSGRSSGVCARKILTL